MLQEDLKFIEISQGTELIVGHHQVPLPFRKDEINLQNNRSEAEKRFACLEGKLSRNPQFKQDQKKFMNELILTICCRGWKMLVLTSLWGLTPKQTWEDTCGI